MCIPTYLMCSTYIIYHTHAYICVCLAVLLYSITFDWVQLHYCCAHSKNVHILLRVKVVVGVGDRFHCTHATCMHSIVCDCAPSILTYDEHSNILQRRVCVWLCSWEFRAVAQAHVDNYLTSGIRIKSLWSLGSHSSSNIRNGCA